MIYEIQTCESKYELNTYHVTATSVKDALWQLEANTEKVVDVGNAIIELDNEEARESLTVRDITQGE